MQAVKSLYTELNIKSSWKLNCGNPCFLKLSIETELKCCSSVSQSSHIPSLLIRDCENHCFDKVMPAVVLRFCQISEIVIKNLCVFEINSFHIKISF